MTKVKAVRNRKEVKPPDGLYIRRNANPRFEVRGSMLVQEIDAHCLDSTTIGLEGVVLVLSHRYSLEENLISISKLKRYIEHIYKEDAQ